MSKPLTKPILFSHMLDDPKAVRQVRDVLGVFSTLCTAFLVFKDFPGSSAMLALGCAAGMIGTLVAGGRLEMLEVRRRIEALESIKRGGEGTEGN
jgi:hypothetical protein